MTAPHPSPTPMTNPDIAKIAEGLTKAQREYLTSRAQWKKPTCWAQERWMTFPPANTHRVLMAQNLVDASGQIREMGLAVRQHLQSVEP